MARKQTEPHTNVQPLKQCIPCHNFFLFLMNCTYTVYTSFSYLCIQMKFLPNNCSQSFVVVVVSVVVETFFSCEEDKKKTKNGKNLKRTRTNSVSW